MKEHPILFTGPMVQAILSGEKTQTRRVVKPPPQMVTGKSIEPWDGDASALMRLLEQSGKRCTYGQSGDRLWVRETWRTAKSLDSKSPAVIGEMCKEAGYKNPWAPLAYEADGHQNSEWRGFELGGDAEPGKTRVSIHMPRWASRILLHVTSVRVERLQDINEADCIAEGIEKTTSGLWSLYGQADVDGTYSPRASYRALWESLNGPGSWDANPWVWVIEFKRV